MNKNQATVYVIIPVKNLDNAKSRLSSLLTEDERKQFCLKMLEDVLRTAKSTKHPHETIVFSKDPIVLKIAKNFDAGYIKERETGLNKTVAEAVDMSVQRRAASLLVLPADIPLVAPSDLKRIFNLGERASMVISPSKNGKGTNALLLTPPNVSPTFYGPDSFQRHIKEASKLKISFRRYWSPRIALDIDTVEDLKYFVSLKATGTSAYKVLEEIGATAKLEKILMD